MSKLKFNLTLLLACLLTAVPASLWADLNYSYDEDAKTATVVKAAEGSAYEGAIVIPATVTKGETEYTVTAVDAGAFSRTAITELTVPSTVTSMGMDAAAYCGSLKKVTLGNGIKTLGQGVFFSSAVEEVIIEGPTTSLPGAPAYFLSSNPTLLADPLTVANLPGTWKPLFSSITANENSEMSQAVYNALLNFYKTKSFTAGTRPGEYSAEGVTAFETAMTAAEGLGANATDADRGKTMAQLVNAANNVSLIPITEGYYFIVSDNAKIAQTQSSEKAAYLDTAADDEGPKGYLYWGELSKTEAKFLFKLTAGEGEGKWNVFNPATKLYVGECLGYTKKVPNSETAASLEFVPLGEASYKWRSMAGTQEWTFCPQGNPGGASAGPSYVWGYNNATAPHVESTWTLVPATDEEVAALFPNQAALAETLATAEQLKDNCWYWKNVIGKGQMEFDSKQTTTLPQGKGTLNGDEVGQIVSNALYAEYTEAIEAAKAAVEAGDEEGAAEINTKLDSLNKVIAAIDTYEAEKDAATLANPLTEGYYVVMAGLADQCNEVIKVMGYDAVAKKMVQQNYAENYAGQIFEVTKSTTEGSWNFKNVAAGQYLGKANGTALELSDEPVNLTLKTHRPDWGYSKRVRLRFFVDGEATNWSTRPTGDDVNAASGQDWQLIWVLRKVDYTPQSDAVEALTKALAESDIAANYPFAYYDDNDQKTLADGSNSCDGTELGQYLPNELRLNLLEARANAQAAVDGGEVTDADATALTQAINEAVEAIQTAYEQLPEFKPGMGADEVAIPLVDGGVYYILHGLADDQAGGYNKVMGAKEDGSLWRMNFDDKANPNFMYKFTKKTVFVTNPEDEEEEVEYTVWNIQNLGTGKYLGQHVTPDGATKQELELADSPKDYLITLTDNSVIQGGNQKKRKRFDFREADWDMTKCLYGNGGSTTTDETKILLNPGPAGWDWRTVWYFRPVPEDLIPKDEPVDTVFTADDIDEGKLYTLTSKRGAMAFGILKGTAANSNKYISSRANVDATDAEQQFAFVKVGDNYYLYNPAAKAAIAHNYAVGCSNAYGPKYALPAKLTLQATGNAEYPTFVKLNRAYINMQNAYTNDSVRAAINSYSTPDDGNRIVIKSVPGSEFDPTEAKAAIEEGLQYYTKKSYGIGGARGNWTIIDGKMAATHKSNKGTEVEAIDPANNANQQWALVYNEGNLYLYNVGQKKFIYKDEAGATNLAKNDATPITYSWGNSVTPNLLVFEDGTWTINNNNSGDVGLGSWYSADDGNKVELTEVADFDDAAALAQLNATRYDVTFNLMNEDSTTFYSYTKDYVYDEEISELPAALKNVYYEYGTVPTITVSTDVAQNVVNVVAKWVGPMELSEAFDDDAAWYALNLRNKSIAIKGNEDGTTAVALNNSYNAKDVLAGDIWAFKGNNFGGFSIYNKKTGLYMKAPVDIANDEVTLSAEENTDWIIVPSQSTAFPDETGAGTGFMLQIKGDDPLNTLNQYGGENSAILKVWHSQNNYTDKGGAFQVQKPNDFVVDAIKAITELPEGIVYSLPADLKDEISNKVEGADALSLAELAEIYDEAVEGQIQPTTGFYRLVNKQYNEKLGIDKDGVFKASTDDLGTIFKLTVEGENVKLAAQGLEIPMMETSAVTKGAEEGITGTLVHAAGTATAAFDFRGDGEHDYPTYCAMHMRANKELVGWESAADASQWYLYPVESVQYPLNLVEGTQDAYATMYLPFTVSVEGADVFTIEYVDGDYAQLKAVNGGVVPAGSPVILKGGANGAFLVPSLEDGEPLEDNILLGTYLEIATPANGMIFSGTPGEIGFYKNAKDAVPANKAYIVDGEGNSNKFILNFSATGIAGAKVDLKNATIYDLQGRRVEKAGKGIYIVNGKKVELK